MNTKTSKQNHCFFSCSLRAASWRSSVSTSPGDIWMYRTTDPLMKQFLTDKSWGYRFLSTTSILCNLILRNWSTDCNVPVTENVFENPRRDDAFFFSPSLNHHSHTYLSTPHHSSTLLPQPFLLTSWKMNRISSSLSLTLSLSLLLTNNFSPSQNLNGNCESYTIGIKHFGGGGGGCCVIKT